MEPIIAIGYNTSTFLLQLPVGTLGGRANSEMVTSFDPILIADL
jgi:hypothetical protein